MVSTCINGFDLNILYRIRISGLWTSFYSASH